MRFVKRRYLGFKSARVPLCPTASRSFAHVPIPYVMPCPHNYSTVCLMYRTKLRCHSKFFWRPQAVEEGARRDLRDLVFA